MYFIIIESVQQQCCKWSRENSKGKYIGRGKYIGKNGKIEKNRDSGGSLYRKNHS